ncbi:exodeoxyribonuclease III [Tsukamurella soli]|uniref:Exodeoxyribonuclease III n=1 Tax=Tsukamurella soli TaxID=644556 RepID=A0ABP8KG07_9ACTN
MFTAATVNVNGIRAATRRGFGEWLAARDPDVVAVQELRCPTRELPCLPGYLACDTGTVAGRNGVGVLTRVPPDAVRSWAGEAVLLTPDGPRPTPAPPGPLARGLRPFAAEGRYLEVDLGDRPVTVGCLYLPKGGLPAELQRPGSMREAPDGGAKYERKMRFLDAFARQLARTRRAAAGRGREYLLMGDLNIAHTELDVTRWRASSKVEGFLPEERAWLGTQLGPRTLVDVVRRLHPDTPGPYSWWSWLGQAFEKDVGWRIDYHLATPRLAAAAVDATVDKAETREGRLADHAPVVVRYEV